MRRDQGSCVRQIMEMVVEGRRRRGRPKARWKDGIVTDSKGKNLDLGMLEDRQRWQRLIKQSDPSIELA